MLTELEVQFGNTYDSELSETSPNAVQNKVVTEAIYNIGGVIEETAINVKSYVDDEINKLDRKKQNVIADLNEIRNKANTALQEHQDISHLATKTSVNSELNKKVDKVSGKGLSTNDFTNNFKTKLEGLNNYNDSEVKNLITSETNRAKSVEQVLTNAITTINGTGTGSMKKTVADEIAKVIDSAPTAFDTLKEIADYIKEDQEAAAVIANDLVEHSNAIEENKSEIVAISKNVTELSQEVSEISEKVDNKADTVGYYPAMRVGLSDNLPDRRDVLEGEIGFRESAGVGNSIEDGTAEVVELLGDSVVWNQLYPTDWTYSRIGVTATSVGGKITVTGVAESTYYNLKQFVDNVANHRYLFLLHSATSGIEGKQFALANRDGASRPQVQNGTAYIIYDNTEPDRERSLVIVGVSVGQTINDSCVINQIDLTKAFPNDWQDINTIEDFYARIPQGIDLNAYNEGEVIGVNMTGIKSVNDNAWDEKWENGSVVLSTGQLASNNNAIRNANIIRVLPNNQYHVISPRDLHVFFYDRDNNYLGWQNQANYRGFTTPQNAYYIRFYCPATTTYNHDICIRLAHSGYKTDYVAHEEDTMVLDTAKYFPDGMHGIGDVRDSVTPKKATRRFGIKKLKDLRWKNDNISASLTGIRFESSAIDDIIKSVPNNAIAPIISSKYVARTAVDTYMAIRGIAVKSTGTLSIYDSAYANAESFAASLTDEDVIIYELAEPIVTDLDPQLNISYKVWDFGTEELLCDKPSANVGVRTIYGFNATDTIRGNKAKINEHEDRIEDIESTMVKKGSYEPSVSVGVADNLSGFDVVASDFVFRRSGGGAISDGVARVESIKGNSVVWNQKVESLNNNANTGNSFIGLTYAYDKSSSILTINGTATGTWQGSILFAKTIINNIYYISAQKVGGSYTKTGSEEVRIFNGYYPSAYPESSPEAIGSLSNNNREYLGIGCGVGDVFDNYQLKIQYINLTQMFGAGNEPTTIEEYNRRKPIVEDENAYNEGEVIHMRAEGIKSVGVNQWDEEWRSGKYDITTGQHIDGNAHICSSNYIRITPNTKYYGVSPLTTWGVFYDYNKHIIPNAHVTINKAEFTTPSNAYYMMFYTMPDYGTTYNNDICINLSDTEINGKYFPYTENAEDLSFIKDIFPNGMKSAGTAHDEIRYNKTSGKWEYSKGKINSVDLGELNWEHDSKNSRMRTNNLRDYIMKPSEDWGNTILCAKYANILWDSSKDKFVTLHQSGWVYIKDTSYTDVTTFKASLQGVILYYESSDWEWVELDKEDQLRNFDYQVWNCGTEQIIATEQSSAIKADITYGFNAVGLIKQLRAMIEDMKTQLANMTINN